MKTLLSISIVLILATSGVFYLSSGEDDKPCIEEWLAQTQDVFANTSRLFSFSENESEPDNEEESLDLKLEALLPSSEMDLSYQHDLSPQEETQVIDTALLPDLFNKPQGPEAKFKGQVHTDENDNIIGAEVQVAIPTDIN